MIHLLWQFYGVIVTDGNDISLQKSVCFFKRQINLLALEGNS